MARALKNTNLSLGKVDWLAFLAILMLFFIGLLFVYEASTVEALDLTGNPYHFVFKQLQWGVIGIIGLIIASFFPLKLLKQFAPTLFIFSLIALFIVLIPGFSSSIKGARRWLELGPISFQPSEITKLSLIIYLAALFEKRHKLVPFLGSVGLVCFLILLEPDLDTTVVIAAVASTMYAVAGAPIKQLAAFFASALAAVFTLVVFSPYRRSRLLTFLNPDRDPQGASYHIKQIVIALGSGSWFGTGFGRSFQKYRFLPEATSDSIFAIIGEETGFIGALTVIGIFVLLIFRGLKIADKTQDKFNALLAFGITTLIAYQCLVNLGAMVALLPLSGITLPLISYGGSSLVISLVSLGLLLNVSRHQK